MTRDNGHELKQKKVQTRYILTMRTVKQWIEFSQGSCTVSTPGGFQDLAIYIVIQAIQALQLTLP